MTTAPVGFDPDGVFTASVQLPARDYPKLADKVRFLEQFEARLRGLPGVQLVAHVGEVPTARQPPGFFDRRGAAADERRAAIRAVCSGVG